MEIRTVNVLKKIIKVMDIAVFVFTTIAIGGVFYEGMTLKWYNIVGVFVICMDYSFMPTTILHLIADRKEKWYPLHIFSMIEYSGAAEPPFRKYEYRKSGIAYRQCFSCCTSLLT